jgi:hypothetical protein
MDATIPEHRKVVALQTLQEVETLRTMWAPCQKTRNSDLDFFAAMVRSRGNRCSPYVLVMTVDGRTDAILIGFREIKTLAFNFGFATVAKREVSRLEFVYGGLLGNDCEDNCIAFVRAIVDSLKNGVADLAFWDRLDIQSTLYRHALTIPGFAIADHCRGVAEHTFMTFPDNLKTFLTATQGSLRSKLRRKYQKAQAHFKQRAEVRCFESTENLPAALNDVGYVAQRSLKGKFGFGFADTPQTRAQLTELAELGWLRIYVLYLEGAPAAFWIGTLYKACLQADFVAYDPAWAAFSPGLFLFLNVVEKLQGHGVRVVDFGCGNDQLHRCFGDFRLTESRIHIYAPNLRGIHLNLLHSATYGGTLLMRRIRWLESARRVVRKRVARIIDALGNPNSEAPRNPADLSPGFGYSESEPGLVPPGPRARCADLAGSMQIQLSQLEAARGQQPTGITGTPSKISLRSACGPDRKF